ncbi:MAG: hypothetical protein FD189_1558 [Elusimicrobia bacterium]|nr:MAG: hypothetical protein FD154_1793 [Elusimicrobiota bacterium]KAF0155047.1 MAG: hypothetical protein FD189_1558 [Elusimicrobiota bacterium]
MGNNVLLEARDLAVAYPSGTENVFSGASFRLYRGDRAALLGDNGSGKSDIPRLSPYVTVTTPHGKPNKMAQGKVTVARWAEEKAGRSGVVRAGSA